LKYYFKDFRVRSYWIEIFKEVKKDRFHDSCWDYQFYFASWMNKGIAIVPNVNLVSNIGFDSDASHTFNKSNSLANQTAQKIHDLTHPSTIKLNKSADVFLHKTFIEPYEFGIGFFYRLPYRINKRIKIFFGKEGSWIKNKIQ